MNIKEGIKTTEFWLSLLVVIIGAVLASGLLGDHIIGKVAGAVQMVLASLGYGASRAKTKAAAHATTPSPQPK